MGSPDLSVIIVNYKTSNLVLNCISSLTNHIGQSFEIILVDNDSGDDVCSKVSSKFPDIRLSCIQMGYNSGFSKANNAGIRIAQGKVILLLNSDTVFIDQSFDKAFDYICHNRNIGILGCELLNEDRTHQHSAYSDFPGIKRVLRRNALYIYFNRGQRRLKEPVESTKEPVQEVKWICGAFMLMNTDVINKNELNFDEDFFLYSEDTELCFRIRKRGKKIIYFPETRILHLNGASSLSSDIRNVQLKVSEFLFIRKSYGLFYFMMYVFALVLNFILDKLLSFKKGILHGLDKDEQIALGESRFALSLLKKNFRNIVFEKEQTSKL